MKPKRLLTLLAEQGKDAQAVRDLDYLLQPDELWARACSQLIATETSFDVVSQHISAENKVVVGNIMYKPYWGGAEFAPVQEVMNVMFTE